MPVDKSTLKLGDKFKATITYNGSKITTTGMVVMVTLGGDQLIHLDCGFDFGSAYSHAVSALESVEAVKKAGFDPTSKEFYWLYRDVIVVDEIVSKAETPPVEAPPAQPNICTLEFIQSLKQGERIRIWIDGKWCTGTFLCRTVDNERMVLIRDDEANTLSIDAYFDATQVKIKDACEALNLPQDKRTYCQPGDLAAERIDVDPEMLNIGDEVEIEYAGKLHNAHIVAKKGGTNTLYSVVFFSKTLRAYRNTSDCYNDAMANIAKLGLMADAKDNENGSLGFEAMKSPYNPSFIRRIIKRAKSIEPAEPKKPTYLDLTKEDLQPGDRIETKDGYAFIVLRARKDKAWYTFDDLLLAKARREDGVAWAFNASNPFTKSSKELGLDTTKFDPGAYCRSHLNFVDSVVSIDRSRRIDPKSIKPGTRVEIEIVDGDEAHRHEVVVVQQTDEYVDYVFDTHHKSQCFRSGLTSNETYVEAAKVLGIDPNKEMLRDAGHKHRIVRRIEPTYIPLDEANLKTGDLIELEVLGKGDTIQRRTAIVIKYTDSSGYVILDAPIHNARSGFRSQDTAYYGIEQEVKEMGYDPKAIPSLHIWRLKQNDWQGYCSKITRVISRAPEKLLEEPKTEQAQETEPEPQTEEDPAEKEAKPSTSIGALLFAGAMFSSFMTAAVESKKAGVRVAEKLSDLESDDLESVEREMSNGD